MSTGFDYVSQPKEEVKVCNLCAQTEFRPFGARDRHGLPVRSVMCQHCGLVFLNPRMTAEAYRDFYRNGNYRAMLSRASGRPVNALTIETGQRAYAKSLVRTLEPWLDGRSGGSLLDVGGSTGVVAEAFRDRWGYEGTVLEPAESEANRAEQRGLRVIRSTVEDYEPDIDRWGPWSTERFDLVLLCQTMDHLLDIAGALRKIHTLLKDDGMFFADIVEGGSIKVDHPYRLDHRVASSFLLGAGFKYKVFAAGSGYHTNFMCEKA